MVIEDNKAVVKRYFEVLDAVMRRCHYVRD
jgi:hypothetical protein